MGEAVDIVDTVFTSQKISWYPFTVGLHIKVHNNDTNARLKGFEPMTTYMAGMGASCCVIDAPTGRHAYQ